MQDKSFDTEYNRLNQAQKEAVDTIEGPVMVVAGPGTGKTQVLSLRIANILQNTDSGADSILCLTFTNSGVAAMRERLRRYIGTEGARVNVSTFHSFGMQMIEEYYHVLDVPEPPKLLDDNTTINIFDHLLLDHDWEHLRPRADNTRYFSDIKSLISLLKRTGMTPHDFATEIKSDIDKLENDPASISSRGPSKGEIKKDVQNKIESLSRTMEVVEFYKKYEAYKKEKNLLDYDDVLQNLVNIVEYSDDARDDIKERFLYVLVDEHQDSTALQNEFLSRVWGRVEEPNVFVVGDDRQLIYGFGGASLEYFEGFKKTFPTAKLITLLENYRSTQNILDVSHALLQSKMSTGKLNSNSAESHPLRIFECDYERDEIIIAADDMRTHQAKHDISFDDCAILVPKNRQVRSAMRILRDLGIPASSGEGVSLFDADESTSLLRVLRVLADPFDSVSLAASFFDPLSGMPPLAAHKFLRENDARNISLAVGTTRQDSLFTDSSPASVWIAALNRWMGMASAMDVYSLIQVVGDEFLLQSAPDHDALTLRVEIVRTFLHLALMETERNPKMKLAEFLEFIDRLQSYNIRIPLAVFDRDRGVRVMTLHSAKGLEFDYVWVAHMDEGSFERGKKQNFTLPEGVVALMEQKDEEALKRELYVAITRARRFCTVSYARLSYEGRDKALSGIVAGITDKLFDKVNAHDLENKIADKDLRAYVTRDMADPEPVDLADLTELVAQQYTSRVVSVSLLNNFFECPWKWYFRNLLRLPEPLSGSLEHGNRVHNAIDKILKLGKTPTTKQILEFCDDDSESAAVVGKWVEQDLPSVAKNRENEQSVSLRDERFPHLNIYGKIDLVEKMPGGNVRVTDFKTGSVRKKSEIEKPDEEERPSNLMRQLAMYSYLLRGSKWQANVDVSRLLFLEAKNDKERIYETTIDADQIDYLVKDIKDYDTLVSSGGWINRPCHFNPYGKAGTTCPYCKMAEIYKN